MPRGGGRSGGRSGGFGRSGGGRSGGGMFGRSTRAAPRAPPRAPPKPAQKSGGLFGGSGGLGATMAQGAAFGVGSGVAHAAVNSVLGGGRSHSGDSGAGAMGPGTGSAGGMETASPTYYDGTQEQTYQNPCQSFNETFLKCLQTNTETIGTCQNEMDLLVQCERQNADIV